MTEFCPWTEPLALADRLCSWDQAQRPDVWARTAPGIDARDMTRLILTLALTRTIHRDRLTPRQVPLAALLLKRWAGIGLSGQSIPPAYRPLWRAFHDDTERIVGFADLQTHANAIVLGHLTHAQHTTRATDITVGQRLQQLHNYL